MEYHPVEFDIDDFLTRIRGNKPPFLCPAETCQKVHKSYAHMQKHMLIHRPPAPIEIPALPNDLANSLAIHGLTNNHSLPPGLRNNTHAATSLWRGSSNCSIVFGPTQATRGQTFRCSILVPLTCHIRSIIELDTTIAPFKPRSATSKCAPSNGKHNSRTNRIKHRPDVTSMTVNQSQKASAESTTDQGTNSVMLTQKEQQNGKTPSLPQLPVAVFEVDPHFVFKKPLAMKENHGYIRFIEKSFEELDEIVEYDLDEEDVFWLLRVNTERKQLSLAPVTEKTLEWVMDRFEKEAKFRLVSVCGKTVDSAPYPTTGHSSIDEDAVCAVCQDGTCENTNVILFCDVCNLAVHQECYGVPYVPEGPWLCRKCLHSPSEAISCVLCPNRGGALKKTADDRWAHVICGLWVPEVMFANLTFLEPLEGIDKIAPARWRLQCFICKERNSGACIQCHKTSCYRAFHVTCAQHAGLYMKIEHSEGGSDTEIRKNAFCDQHCPPNHFKGVNSGMYAHSDSESIHSPEQVARLQLRKARKVLAERRNCKPNICVPIVPKAKIECMASNLDHLSGDVMSFLGKAYTFWKLKREVRRGVPLLKRLQASSVHRSAANFAAAATTDDAECQHMRAQLKFWQHLRQNLERARLLSELTRKRERVKRELFRLFIAEIEIKVDAIDVFLLRLLEQLQALDEQQFFAEPVGPELAPDYNVIIKHPMDFSTMRDKIKNSAYLSVAELETDFNLMISNCFRYNRRNSIYYTSATALSEQGGHVIQQAKLVAQSIDLSSHSGGLSTCIPKTETPHHVPSTQSLHVADYAVLVKENHLVPREKREETPVTKIAVDETSQKTVSYAPLREIVNGHLPPPQDDDGTTTRSRLRSADLCPKIKQATLSSYLSPIELPTRKSRKRRRSSISPNCKDDQSPSDLYRPSAKHERLEVNGVGGTEQQLWPSHAKFPTLFTASLSTDTPTPRHSNTATSQWIHTSSSGCHGVTNPIANSTTTSFGHLNAKSAKPSTPTTTANSHPLTKDTLLHGSVSRQDPAFTRYRLSRPLRCEEEDDDDDDEEEDDDDEDDDDEEEDESFGNDKPYVGSSGNSWRANSAHTRGTRQSLHCSQLSMGSSGSLVRTTLVGKSRMASRRPSRVARLGLLDSGNSSKGGRRMHSRPGCSRGRLRKPPLEPIQLDRNGKILELSTGFNPGGPQSDNEDSSQKHPAVVPAPPELTGSSLCSEFGDNNSSSPEPMRANVALEFESQSNSVPSSPSTRSRLMDSFSNERPICPLDVVWAKCRGSPWYPALVIDSAATEGYSHNGVPVPLPPDSVLHWGQRLSESDFASPDSPDMLVLFFDTKRTWQWLSRHKLHLLGSSAAIDQERMREGRRSKMKHSVVQAYRRAVEHLCKVHGRPYPYTELSGKSSDLNVFTL